MVLMLAGEIRADEPCSPAGRMGEIADTDKRVFVLSFQVDYWNRLRWKDPFSQRAFSDRQRSYAQVLDDHRVYTRQMIVNRTAGF